MPLGQSAPDARQDPSGHLTGAVAGHATAEGQTASSPFAAAAVARTQKVVPGQRTFPAAQIVESVGHSPAARHEPSGHLERPAGQKTPVGHNCDDTAHVPSAHWKGRVALQPTGVPPEISEASHSSVDSRHSPVGQSTKEPGHVVVDAQELPAAMHRPSGQRVSPTPHGVPVWQSAAEATHCKPPQLNGRDAGHDTPVGHWSRERTQLLSGHMTDSHCWSSRHSNDDAAHDPSGQRMNPTAQVRTVESVAAHGLAAPSMALHAPLSQRTQPVPALAEKIVWRCASVSDAHGPLCSQSH